eukprot:gene10320-biopygen1049
MPRAGQTRREPEALLGAGSRVIPAPHEDCTCRVQQRPRRVPRSREAHAATHRIRLHYPERTHPPTPRVRIGSAAGGLALQGSSDEQCCQWPGTPGMLPLEGLFDG